MARTDETETADKTEIVVECEIEAAPERLWQALTDEALASDWLGARPDGTAPSGERSFRVVEAEPYAKVRYAWRDEDCPDAPPSVTVELERLPGGHTRLRLTHGPAPAVRRQPANANRPLALAA